MTETTPKAIVLFDGVCNFCNASVNLIIDHDPDHHFQFAALQSDKAKQLLRDAGMEGHDLDSIVLIEDGRASSRSTAALRIARHLSGMYKVLWIFIAVPRPIRDWAYGVIARNRYRWFGKTEACRMPTPDVKARFVG